MKRRAFVAILALSAAQLAQAMPPPVPPPPLSPEAEAAADALAAEIPIEEALNRGDILASDGGVAFRIAERLVSLVDPRRHLGCDPGILTQYLAPRVAPLLPVSLPQVAREFRRSFADEVGYSMGIPDLVAARALVRSPAGHALMTGAWRIALRTNDEIVALFTRALAGESESLLRAAQADCRAAHGRPPPYID